MKVLAILIVVVSSAAARGSGPYLPSGWRPDGPAFFLPGEVQTEPSDNPLKETLFQETEASGSDFLREYGPPKVQEVSQDITQQGLPDVVTEQVFNADQARTIQEEVTEEVKDTEEAVTENDVTTVEQEAAVITEESSTVAEEAAATTEVLANDEVTTEQAKEEPQGRAVKLEVEASVAETTDGFVEAGIVTESDSVTEQQDVTGVVTESDSDTEQQDVTSDVKDVVKKTTEQLEKIEDIVNSEVFKQDIVQSVVQGAIEENVQQTVKILEEVKNIAEEIVKVESEVAQEQNVDVSGVKSVQVSGSVQQVPEGFSEYGPPGFKEYGPPKADDLLRSSAVQEKSESELIENNETRRRRFSPKFRPSKQH